ncbi:HNH endonuclease [Vibrio fluvialis]|uniref:HNH endonuclease n=1 Tax=Vibrio fluvialis TaxID=676 RepID=UPI001EEA867C|nr:HNH endonuclease [Vibrio fluvialis]MCG6400682.1 hypothetical protein [Vibrio fluvialis]
MPLINNVINYEPQDNALIREKFDSGTFSHSDWSADELMPLRSKIRAFYRSEQLGVCAYCKSDVSLTSAGNAHIEHIAPKSLHLDFIFEPKNLCVVCADCNTIKRNQEVINEVPDTFSRSVTLYPRSSGAFKIVHPYFDDYDDHILIKGRIYIDKSDKGAFTISACKLNRYYHEFDIDDDFVDDEELVREMTEFLDARSSLKKAQILNRLRDMLFNL